MSEFYELGSERPPLDAQKPFLGDDRTLIRATFILGALLVLWCPAMLMAKQLPRLTRGGRLADAVVGIDIDYEVVGANGSMLMVSVSGTAVKL